jgi:hypothetical protein
MLSFKSAFVPGLVRNAFAVVSVATIFLVMVWTFEQNGCQTHVIRLDNSWLLARLRDFEEFGQKWPT